MYLNAQDSDFIMLDPCRGVEFLSVESLPAVSVYIARTCYKYLKL